MGYHVLSNSQMTSILSYAFFSGLALGFIFSFLAQRDAIFPPQKKGLLRKIIPWIVLCIFLSDISLLIYRISYYPWDIEPQPSQASIFREMNYMSSGYPVWGWANDDQLPIISTLTGALMWLCWTVYAFQFKPSATSWWKKVCKVVAYLTLSMIIIGFNMHELSDVGLYIGLIIVIVILLWIAKVKHQKNDMVYAIEANGDNMGNMPMAGKDEKNEDSTRFMPQPIVEMPPLPNDTIHQDVHKVIITEPPMPPTHDVIKSEPEASVPQPQQRDDKKNVYQEPENNSEIEMMYCKYCGKRIEADSIFCKHCGKRL